MKLETLKAQLEKNIKDEYETVKHRAEFMVAIAGDVRNLSRKDRQYYRDLINYRDCIANNLETVKGWSIHVFVKQLHVDTTVHQWLGWQ